MANLTDAEKLNLAFKMVFGIQGTSNTNDSTGLDWYEERYGWRPFLLNDDLYVDTVPFATNATEADNAALNNPSIVEKRTIELSPVIGTNNRAWVAYQTPGDETSGIYGDWLIPQIFGKGYAIKLYQDDGTGTAPGVEITTTQGAWVPSYKMGFIILGTGHTAIDEGWAQPLWVVAYRYIGSVGITGGTIPGLNLDAAYNGGTSIDIDNGPITLNPSNNSSHIQFTPISYTPSGTTAGQIANIDGILYNYDGVRNKWLSVDQVSKNFSARKGDANYLSSTGFQGDTNSGYTALRNGTIVGVSSSGGSGNLTKGFEIRSNGSLTPLYSFNLNSGTHFDATLDIDFSAGDVLQIYCSATGAPVNSPEVNLVFAWRK